MENLDPQNSQDFFKVASKLKDHFLGGSPQVRRNPPGSNGRSVAKGEIKGQGRAKPERKKNLPVLVNPPLDFELKNLDPEHPYLHDRGFSPTTIKHFGLGFCGKGSLKDRIAIPLEDPNGNLIGYAGRVVDDEAVSPENPKYLFPSERERSGKILKFQKSAFLYNGWRIEKPVRDLVVVEGFAATWWLWQNGVSDVVALMGASCSVEQGRLIVKHLAPDGCLWIFTDGDEAGRKCGASVFLQVAPHRYTRSVVCDDGKQPTDWTAEELMGSFPSLNEESGHSDEPIGASDQGNTDETQDLAAAS